MSPWRASRQDLRPLVEDAERIAHPLEQNQDLDALIDQIGGARFVLLGEASHGTSEFYSWRARLSQRLIEEKGFSFIAVEGDWPDCYKINRYVKNYENAGQSAYETLQAFDRWPSWMWANWEVAALAEWMRNYNQRSGRAAGFYGLDVYSLWESMRSVMQYLEKKDPHMAQLAKNAIRCFEPYGENVQAYAWSTRMAPESCEDEVIGLLSEMRQNPTRYDSDPEAAFNAEQNALVMVNAERYYRAMVRSDLNSWNVRDIHMMETLNRLMAHHGPESKAIVWAHNTHIGDARATDMARDGMVNLGQLVREEYGEENACLVGFGTHHGTVIAGQAWDAPMEVMGVPDAVEGSWEDVLYQTGRADFFLLLGETRGSKRFEQERGQRAIGVVYDPNRERYGNYVPTVLPARYDAFLFFAETRALHPLHLKIEEKNQVPDTYPWGL
jgi:erythromycin esterase